MARLPRMPLQRQQCAELMTWLFESTSLCDIRLSGASLSPDQLSTCMTGVSIVLGWMLCNEYTTADQRTCTLSLELPDPWCEYCEGHSWYPALHSGQSATLHCLKASIYYDSCFYIALACIAHRSVASCCSVSLLRQSTWCVLEASVIGRVRSIGRCCAPVVFMHVSPVTHGVLVEFVATHFGTASLHCLASIERCYLCYYWLCMYSVHATLMADMHRGRLQAWHVLIAERAASGKSSVVSGTCRTAPSFPTRCEASGTCWPAILLLLQLCSCCMHGPTVCVFSRV